jgi:predicted dehydrogenase
MGSPYVLANAPRVALIGGGFIGPVHAEALRRIGVEVVGLLGSRPERAQPLANRLGIPRVYRDFDELIADDRVGSVHVASPNAAHFEHAKHVLESGRHLMCEKPLATTSAETSALVQLAASRPQQATAVNYNVRFYPICREMRARVARGDLGRILSVTGCYTQDWLLRPADYNWRVEPDGGTNLRTVGDIGTHWMDLAQYVVGQPIERVCADIATFHPERLRPTGPSETFAGSGGPTATERVPVATEDYASVLVHFSGGARGVFHVTQMLAGRKNRILLEVAGTDGSLAWDGESPGALWLGHRDGPNGILHSGPGLLDASVGPAVHYPGGHAEGFPDTFKQLYLAFYEWIQNSLSGPSPCPTLADGDYEVRLCEAVARSAKDGRWVPVESFGAGAQ